MKKWIALLLVGILSLSMVFAAQADTQIVLQGKISEDLAGTSAVNDLLDVTNLSLSYNENAYALTLNISEQDVTSIIVKPDTDGIIVSNDIVSEKPVYIAYEDLAKFVQTSADGNLFSTDYLLAIKDTAMKDEKILQFLTNLLSKVATEEGSFQFDDADSASEHTKIALDAEDFLPLYESETLSQVIEAVVSLNEQTNGNSTQEIEEEVEEVKKELAEMVEKIKEKKITMDLQVNIYSENSCLTRLDMINKVVDEDDTIELVAAFAKKTLDDASVNYHMVIEAKENEDDNGCIDILYNAKEDESGKYDTLTAVVSEDEKEYLKITGNYSETTTENGKHQEASAKIGSDNEAEMAFTKDTESDEKFEASFAVKAFDTQVTAVLNHNQEADAINDNLQIYLRNNAAALIDLAPSDVPVLEFNVKTSEISESIASTLNNVTPEDCVQPLKMTESELQEWTTDISTRAMSKVFECFSLIPTSALEIFMN